MITSYEQIFTRFVRKIKSYDWINLNEDELREIFNGYLDSAISNYHIKKTQLSERDEIGFLIELDNTEIEIIVDYMIIEWVDSEFIQTPMALKSRLTSKDFQSWSPGNHLSRLVDLKRTLSIEVSQKASIDSYGFSDGSFQKSYLERYKRRQSI